MRKPLDTFYNKDTDSTIGTINKSYKLYTMHGVGDVAGIRSIPHGEHSGTKYGREHASPTVIK